MTIEAGGIRRAFTLLELLVALALLVLLGALTLPAISGFADSANLSTTSSIVASAFRAASAIAQDHAVVTELVARPGPDGSFRLVVRPLDDAAGDDAEAKDADGSAPAPARDTESKTSARARDRATAGSSEQAPPAAWSEVLASLPPGFRVQAAAPTLAPHSGPAAPAPEAAGPDSASPEDPSIVLAVFLPDGSLLHASELYLGDSTHWLRGEVSQVTARVRFEPFTPAAPDGSPTEEAKTNPDSDAPAEPAAVPSTGAPAATPTPPPDGGPNPDSKERPDDARPRGPS